ncbi:MAG: VOC family protein [Scytolyngbya sp. HA4215-MV1]|jgi:hypothetical protein|nr:VOC family protein [Scytolyngbya sp. HA4215-MV1]
MPQTYFHLAFPVTNIPQTKEFYAQGLGCQIGRETIDSVILNLYGNQLVAHVAHEPLTPQKGIYPRHFGIIFADQTNWKDLLERAQQQDLRFYQKPKQRFVGLPLEHYTFFLEDPFYNLLEFKFYRHASAIFGDREYAQIGDPHEAVPQHSTPN